MRHRHLSNSYPRPGIEQHGSSHTPTEQSYFPTGRVVAPENGPYVGPVNHMAIHRNLEGRTNEYPSSNVNMEVQPYVPFDPYSHSSITQNRSLPPVTPVGHANSTNYNVPSMHNYNVPSMRDMEAELSNLPTTGNGGALKRKRSGSFYSAGSSSGSSQMQMEKPPVDCQSVPPYRGSLIIGGEDSSRNVRRRYRVDLEPNMTRPHVPTHSSQFYHSDPVQHTNLDVDIGQWNCVPPHYSSSSHRRISPSDMSWSRQFHIGGSSADVRDPFFSRHSVSSSHTPSMREEHVNHSRRAESSYGNSSRYSHYAHGGTSSTNGLHTPPDNFSSRNSRHWRSNYRSGRPRIAIGRFPSVIDTTESHDRMGHESMMMVDRTPFYGSSRNFSDQYRDLRLDIDNMSYEELLNLEERIGIVNTGLSEDNMSKCLIEKVHCCLDQNQKELSCPICLEEYENGDKIGAMEKCGHEYHVDCIKKWLLMKKSCPICKTEPNPSSYTTNQI